MSKGFIKTSEAILAVMLVFTLFSYLSQRIAAPILSVEKDTTSVQDSVLDMLAPELKDDLKACDLSRVQYLLDSFKPGDMDGKMEITQITSVKITSEANLSLRNVSFTYNFPNYVDKNSVSAYSVLKNYPVSVNWNWYELPIIIQNDLVARKDYDLLLTGLNLSESGVVNDSLVFYWDNREVLIDLKSFSAHAGYSLANISVRIPSLLPGESGTGYLLFAVNSTYFRQDYSSLGSNNVSYEAVSVQGSSRGDVFLSLDELNGSENVYLEYHVGSEVNRSYPLIGGVNNSGVDFKVYWSDLKPCTSFHYEQPPVSTFYNTKKVFYYGDSTMILELRMWYPWV